MKHRTYVRLTSIGVKIAPIVILSVLSFTLINADPKASAAGIFLCLDLLLAFLYLLSCTYKFCTSHKILICYSMVMAAASYNGAVPITASAIMSTIGLCLVIYTSWKDITKQ